jgi:hypothetical protein
MGAAILAVALLAAGRPSYAQGNNSLLNAEFEKDLAMLRQDLRSGKKQLLAANLPLTDTEATKFWPVYDQYVGEMTAQNDQFYGVIKEYIANQKTLTDDQAAALIKKWADIQVGIAGVRVKYIPLVGKVLPGKKAALFWQIDRRIYALMDLQVASALPLVQQ